jgi:hypothetical protein
MLAKFVALLSATFLLVAGTTGIASAKSESWAGKKLVKVQHVKPASESWAGQHWTSKRPSSESWSSVKPRSESWS